MNTDRRNLINHAETSFFEEKAMFVYDVDSLYMLDANDIAIAQYGYSKKELLERKITDLGKKLPLSKLKLKHPETSGSDFEDLWYHQNKQGDKWIVQLTSQEFRYHGKPVKMVIAHSIEHLIENDELDTQRLPKIDRELSDFIKHEEKLKRNEQLFEQLFRNSPLGIALLDKDSKIIQVNDSFESMFGFYQNDIKGLNLDELIVPEEELEEVRFLWEHKERFTLTKKRRTKSGRMIDVFIYGVPVVLEGETIAMYGIYMDITDRIEAENRVKKSLREKEVLLSEIHHRVKNNLAVITGLLELQYHNLKSEEAKNALHDSQMRINSMALIHEKLYQNENLSNIDFGVYIKELVQVIVKSHSREGFSVDVEMQSDPVKLPIIKAIPCGLIINEVVTNSMKYAFSGQHDHPKIRISLKKQSGNATIHLADNGVGLPMPFEKIGKGSLGTLLIKTLIRQLGADLKVNGSDGTTYEFTFELEK